MSEEIQEAADPVEEAEQDVNLTEDVEDSDSSPEEEASSEEEDTAVEQPKKKNGVQKRIDELVREREDWKQQARYFAEQARAKEEAQQVAEEPEPKLEKPKVDNFDSYEEYIDALTDYKTQVAIEQRVEQNREARAQREQESQQQALQQSINESIAKGRIKYADFESVALSADIPVSQAMAESIGESDIGEDLAYYFGSNRQEAARISQLSPSQAYRAIGAIEAKLSTQSQAAQKSNAPAPIKPVSKKATIDRNPEDMNIDDWMKNRMKQVYG